MTPAARFAYGFAWMRYLAQRIGWPGVLGLALAVVAAGIDLLATGRLAEQNAKLAQGIARQRAQAARAAENNLPVHATLLAQLPGGSDLAPVIAAIHAAPASTRLPSSRANMSGRTAPPTRLPTHLQTQPPTHLPTRLPNQPPATACPSPPAAPTRSCAHGPMTS